MSIRLGPWRHLAAAVVLLACNRASDARGISTGAAATAPAAASGSAASQLGSASTPHASERWPAEAAEHGQQLTAGIIEYRPGPREIALLTDVRAARHAGYDRVVFEFGKGAAPGFHLEYIDRPVRRCGSGDTTPIAGDGWLEVRFEPANAHTPSGAATIAKREQVVELEIVKELEQTCDFEAVVSWVLGVQRPNRYRVLTLNDPLRLVVDVEH
jgi:hypothetical protein